MRSPRRPLAEYRPFLRPPDLEAVNRFHCPPATKQCCGADETISQVGEGTPKRAPDIKPPIKQRGAIMWTLISLLYREYCRARLAEIRKYNAA
jgi:hypothetical protein